MPTSARAPANVGRPGSVPVKPQPAGGTGIEAPKGSLLPARSTACTATSTLRLTLVGLAQGRHSWRLAGSADSLRPGRDRCHAGRKTREPGGLVGAHHEDRLTVAVRRQHHHRDRVRQAGVDDERQHRRRDLRDAEAVRRDDAQVVAPVGERARDVLVRADGERRTVQAAVEARSALVGDELCDDLGGLDRRERRAACARPAPPRPLPRGHASGSWRRRARCRRARPRRSRPARARNRRSPRRCSTCTPGRCRAPPPRARRPPARRRRAA